MVSPHATRSGGVRMVAQPGEFTACKVCNKPGQRTPIWSVKASRVVYDELAHRIFYRDAIINFMGVPVAYTPFFMHPDPTVKHSSGILPPEVGSHTTLGYVLRVPVYIRTERFAGHDHCAACYADRRRATGGRISSEVGEWRPVAAGQRRERSPCRALWKPEPDLQLAVRLRHHSRGQHLAFRF